MIKIQEKRRAKIKLSIKSAALSIARKEGWNNVTIRKIAEAILYTPPVVYEHFKNKSDLFNSLVSDGFEDLYNQTLDATSRVESPDEKLKQMALTRFDFAMSNQTLHSMMFNSTNPQWGKVEILKAMKNIKVLVNDWLYQICKDELKCDELFINLIALIMGYTFIARHMNEDKRLIKHLNPRLDENENIREHYTNAIDRFIESIKYK